MRAGLIAVDNLANPTMQARINGRCSRYAALVREVTGKRVLEDLHDEQQGWMADNVRMS